MKNSTMKASRMIIISLDAAGEPDLAYIKEMPNFRRFFERAALCPHVESVYPSLTYPAHAAIVTGCRPKTTGIVNNLRFQPWRKKPDWFWQRRFIKRTTIYDEAAKKGMKTAAFLWPVTGRAGISWNLPEVWANHFWENQVTVSFANGTPSFQLDLYRRFGKMLDGVRQPNLDNFVQSSFLYSMKKYQPDLALVHWTDVDTNRHDYGVSSPEAMEAFCRHDRRLGEVFQLLEEMGWEEDTDLVLLGDHYQMDTNRIAYPNYYLKKLGWLEPGTNGIRRWQVLGRESGGSCNIYVKDERRIPVVRRFLESWKARPDSPVEEIFDREEAAAMGADPRAAFVLEAKEGWYFQNGLECASEAVNREKNPDHHLGNHGFHPKRGGYQTFFAGAGPDFMAGARKNDMKLIDEGPTLARILGVKLTGSEGQAALELLAD